MNLLRKKESKKEIKNNLKIQIQNNKVLREYLKKEQEFNMKLSQENAKLKDNVRILSEDNEQLAGMLNELVIKYNVKFETNEKPKRKKTTKKETK